LVTLPIAGALGATTIIQQVRSRRARRAAPVVAVEELTSEQVL
jgi:hypothetical protein